MALAGEAKNVLQANEFVENFGRKLQALCRVSLLDAHCTTWTHWLRAPAEKNFCK